MKAVRLPVSVFKSHAEPYGNILLPVSAGADLYHENDPLLSLHDNTGENISRKNPSYCELTVQYWAWKNVDCDVCGLFHQRRYLDFSGTPCQRPYRILDTPDEHTVQTLGLDSVADWTDQYPIIASARENLYESVEAFYNRNDRRQFDDIKLLREVIADLYPAYSSSAEQYFRGTMSYFCNIFVMEKQQFDRYSQWLFDILFEYEKRKPKELCYPREMGKLGERLFGVYMTYIAAQTDIAWTELPRVHFASVNGTTLKNLSFNKYLYAVCPPGTRRRAILRKFKQIR